MGFSNYLTSYKLHLLKHIRSVFTFNDTSALTEAETKAYVHRLTAESAIPIPEETYQWLSNFFRYVKDKDQLLVYNNTSGLWRFERDDSAMTNMLTDFFSLVADEALKNRDQIMFRYAQHFFSPVKVKTAIAYSVARSDDIVSRTEHLRYFETTNGKRALLDMRRNKFNLAPQTFQQTQPLMLMHKAPMPIHITDEPPHLWLKLIRTYMLDDPDRIAYFEKVLAYLMSPYNYNQVMLYFVGDGRNGKGTIIKVLQDILGSHAVRMNADLLNSQPNIGFKKDDALAATEGKSLLIFNEIDERMVASTQNIKDLTEGGRDEFGNKILTVLRPAYSRNYEVNICGIPLVVANSLINFGDWSMLDPIFKRLILVPFDYHIVKEDPTILNQLAQEYPKIQAWLYMNYFKHKGIRLKDEPKPMATERLFIQYREDSDIINMFLKDCVMDVPGEKVLRSDLYRMYQTYCRINGRKPIRNKGTNGFQNLIHSFLQQHGEVHSNGQVYIKNIRKTVYYVKEIEAVAY